MQPLSPSRFYTAAEVRDALHAPARRLTYRFDLHDVEGVYLGAVDSVTGGKVANNALADLKRTATFELIDAGEVNYLSDRMLPYARLAMPSGTKVIPQPDAVSWAERRRNQALNPVGPASPNADGWRSTGSLGRLVEGGRPFLRLTEDQADTSLYTDPNVNIVAAVGDTIRLTAEVRTNNTELAGNMWLRVYAYNGGALDGGSASLPIPVNTWTRLTFEVVVTAAPEGSYFRTLIWPTGGYPAGTFFDFREVAVEAGQNLPPAAFFDGESATSGPTSRYRWLGTPHASASVLEDMVRTPTPPLVVTDTRPGFVEWPLGVFLLESPDRELSGTGVVSRSVTAYDQLAILSGDRVVSRLSLAAGTVYTDAITTIATDAGVRLLVTPSALTLPSAMEWEPGTTRLRIVNDLLAAINYESAWFDELGRLVVRPYLSPADRSAEYAYITDDKSVIAASGLKQSLDVFDVPNQWVLTVSEADRAPITATYTNTNPNSPTSTVARGRTIVDFRDSEDAPDYATLLAKAKRLAFEASQIVERATFDTLAMPLHSNADVLELTVPRLGLGGVFSEQSWELPLKSGARMRHTARRVVTV